MPMEAQEFIELLDKLIDKKLERLHIDGKDLNLRQSELDREIAALKTQIIELLQPLFT